MGKGDKKTAKGKRSQGSYGITRKRSSATKNTTPSAPVEVKEKVEKKTTKPAAKKTTKKVEGETPKKAASATKKTPAKKAKED